MSNWWQRVTPWLARIDTSGVGWYLARWRWWRSLTPADKYLIKTRVSPDWCQGQNRLR